jgi:hypothetical protein
MTLHESVYEALPELAGEGGYETAHETPYWGAEIAGQAARAALEAVHELAAEGEGEFESELNPVRRAYPDAEMEHLAHAALEARTEDEAGEAFLPLIGLAAAKLLPLAMKAAPLIAKAAPKVMKLMPRIAPHLTRGVGNIARTLFRNPATRRLLRSVPSIARRTLGSITRQVAAGRPMTPAQAVRTLAQQANGMLRRPARIQAAVRRSQALDARAHRMIGSGAGGSAGGLPAGGCRCRGGGGGTAMPAMPPMMPGMFPMMTGVPQMPMPMPVPGVSASAGGCVCPGPAGQAEYEGTLGCGLKGDQCVNHGGCSGQCQRQCKWYWPPPFDMCWFPSCKCVK